MEIDYETAARFGGESEIRARVQAFRAALAAHRLTKGEAAPVENGLIERLARSGETFTVEPAPPPREPPPEPAVPLLVSTRQARRALLAFGMLDAVQAWIDNQAPPETRIDWEYASMIERNSPLIGVAARALGISEAEMDALFVAAAQF